MPKTSSAKPKAKKRILELLKTRGPQESTELASELGVSAMAVRQHLYDYQEKGWITFDENPRPMGRPAKLWKLTEKADAFFPDRHNDLLLQFIEGVRETQGEAGMDQIIQHRIKNQIKDFKSRLKDKTNLNQRVTELCKIRSEEGYMGEVEKLGKDSYRLIENHCPICRAAQNCSNLCASELKVFQTVLGKNVSIQRDEHIVSGDRRCTYTISSKSEK